MSQEWPTSEAALMDRVCSASARDGQEGLEPRLLYGFPRLFRRRSETDTRKKPSNGGK